ncbi:MULTISPECIES: DUF4870 domain-containing protein [Pseudomonas]|uniref:DUF4870 domain-containing protein n=1 Tax=Pseudomonas soli TaxID=1306993 RepID=A0A2V4ITD2_9PSED|nr:MULTISPECIES: DUF4870 domain-containing protein [Pseudomonas]PMZ92351.1 DUF4870 domain-containing protein [Pseudomonas sp. FW305-42]PNA28097.1 DUF4870 domain-containing protein [Pseudomonas sp. MPR-R1B]PNB25253.1 DUF4870 domain-containing protein [Pseudomonas sp. DP16D-E2]PNB45688.1 DUF4870 domain-containing protein [Pseudomonas sp. FW305-17]PNB58627.1 DUF4870 domain-containing protein [Pseudomonas sp. GW531-E2]
MNDSDLPITPPSADVRQWAMFCHLSALLGLVLPLGHLLGPLVLWHLKREQDPFIDAQGKETLNFQISVTIAGFVCFLLMFVFIGILLFAVLMVTVLILIILAAVKANEGQPYRYPFIWRPIR